MRANMRPKLMVTLIFVASLLVFARTSAAQDQMQNMQMPANGDSGQQQAAKPGAPADHSGGMSGGMMGGGMMSPDMMQMMMRAQGGGHGHDGDGALQGISRFMKAIDDPQTRASLGISDSQADSLRKIVTDVEILTIQNAANIAVDSIQLKELLRADKPDKAAVMSKGDDISKATSGLISHYLEACLSAKAILSPEQQKALREYMENGAPAMPAPHMAHR